MLKFDSQLWPNPISRNHNINKLESTLIKDVFTQVTAFMANWILGWNIPLIKKTTSVENNLTSFLLTHNY